MSTQKQFIQTQMCWMREIGTRNPHYRERKMWGFVPQELPANFCKESCLCLPSRFQSKMASIQPMVCIKSDSPLRMSEMTFVPSDELVYKMNPSKVYYHMQRSLRHAQAASHFLILPSPCPVNVAWKEKHSFRCFLIVKDLAI